MTKHEVIVAVQLNMFRDTEYGAHAMRFELCTDAAGEIVIKVNPR